MRYLIDVDKRIEQAENNQKYTSLEAQLSEYRHLITNSRGAARCAPTT